MVIVGFWGFGKGVRGVGGGVCCLLGLLCLVFMGVVLVLGFEEIGDKFCGVG